MTNTETGTPAEITALKQRIKEQVEAGSLKGLAELQEAVRRAERELTNGARRGMSYPSPNSNKGKIIEYVKENPGCATREVQDYMYMIRQTSADSVGTDLYQMRVHGFVAIVKDGIMNRYSVTEPS